jgi:hypothetical protein
MTTTKSIRFILGANILVTAIQCVQIAFDPTTRANTFPAAVLAVLDLLYIALNVYAWHKLDLLREQTMYAMLYAWDRMHPNSPDQNGIYMRPIDPQPDRNAR